MSVYLLPGNGGSMIGFECPYHEYIVLLKLLGLFHSYVSPYDRVLTTSMRSQARICVFRPYAFVGGILHC